MPSLPEPVVDVAEHQGIMWAVTTNRCDPSVDANGVGCKTTLWRLDDELWQEIPELGGQHLPDNLEDIEFDAAGTLWIVTTDGALYTWDGDEIDLVVETGRFPNDGIAITGDGTIWTARFNPFFPEDLGLAQLNTELGEFQPLDPVDGGNHHAVMTPTPDGDLWVWLSGFPSTADNWDGIALGFYDSDTTEWAVHTSDLPQGWVRAMTAGDGAVWIVTSSAEGSSLWRFDGETWTNRITRPGAEILDVGVAPDGTVWYVEDNTLTSVDVETTSYEGGAGGGS